MKRDLVLIPQSSAFPPLSLEWNDETGELHGSGAAFARELIAQAVRMRFVPIDPVPCSHQLGAAPHSLADMAAIFGRWYTLPRWLDAARPQAENWAAGDDDGIEPVY